MLWSATYWRKKSPAEMYFRFSLSASAFAAVDVPEAIGPDIVIDLYMKEGYHEARTLDK